VGIIALFVLGLLVQYKHRRDNPRAPKGGMASPNSDQYYAANNISITHY